MKGFLYFLVIIFANTLGAISGMGGGVIIKPVLDFFALDSVATISFYATVAVFVMSLVSTQRQLKQGIHFDYKIASWLIIGATAGGIVGNLLFEWLLQQIQEHELLLIQIGLTIITLLFALFSTHFNWRSWQL